MSFKRFVSEAFGGADLSGRNITRDQMSFGVGDKISVSGGYIEVTDIRVGSAAFRPTTRIYYEYNINGKSGHENNSVETFLKMLDE